MRSPWPRLAVFGLFIVVATWFAVAYGVETVTWVRGWIGETGPVGIPLFAVAIAVAGTLLLPITPLSVASGLLFGPVVGLAVLWSGAMLGAAASYELGRVMSRSALDKLIGTRAERVSRFLERRGVMTVALLRMVPVMPFFLVNYGSGATRLTRRKFLLGTAIGLVPVEGAWVLLGDNITEPGSPEFMIAVGAIVVFLVGGAIVGRRLRSRVAEEE